MQGAKQDDDGDRGDKGRQPRIAEGIIDLGPNHRRLRKVVTPLGYALSELRLA